MVSKIAFFKRFICLLMLVGGGVSHAETVTRDIPWVTVNERVLTLDIHQPDTSSGSRPVVVVFHGGGWLINTNQIMEQMSSYLATHGNYVVVNVNYRLLGDENNTVTIDDMVEDAMGAVLWVQERIQSYGGNPSQIIVTGDSAGGHLAAMVLTAGNKLDEEGFTPDSFSFAPTYLPADMSVTSLMAKGGISVQGAVLSYGAFDLKAAAQEGFESAENGFWEMGNASPRGLLGADFNVTTTPDAYESISPVYLVPDQSVRQLPPQFIHVGEVDTVTPPVAVRAYAQALQRAKQPFVYRVYAGRNHAFLDNDCNEYLQVCFDRDAPQVLDDIIKFINDVVGAEYH